MIPRTRNAIEALFLVRSPAARDVRMPNLVLASNSACAVCAAPDTSPDFRGRYASSGAVLAAHVQDCLARP
jgi:hypothetical protein